MQILGILLLVGCASGSGGLDDGSEDIARVKNISDADKLFVVDCLLPGQVRQLGTMTTYLTARRPIKTTAIDCEIRGGEYVAYDRANVSSSLKIWLPKAQSGDAEAQTYVGEIYQKGQGMPPDYRSAADWFRKAAAQGNSRAQINLGYLYEQGLGVEKNVALAMEWYQKASGLEAKNIPYAATLNTAAQDDLQAEIKLLKTELNKSRNESALLSGKLSETQNQLRQSLGQLDTYQTERDKAKSALEGAQTKGNAEQQQRLEKILQEKNEELSRQAQLVSDLKARYEGQVADLKNQLGETEKRATQIHDQLKNQQALTDDSQLKLLDAEAKLANTEKQLISKMKGELEASEEEQRKSQTLISQLQAEKQKYEAQIKSLKQSGSTVATRQQPSIEIIDPPFVLLRGVPTVTLRSAVQEREIIGKAASPAGILSVMVNDVKNQVDDKGIFKASVKINRDKTPVNVVAVDQNGGRASLEFLLALDEENIQENGRGAGEVLTPSPQQNWSQFDFGNYYALIIGNNRYEKLPQLDTPANDAQEVEKILRDKYGFNTKLLIDANRYQILSAMNELRGKLTEKDNLLIYYAGHGELDKVNMRGHWLPVDAEADNNANWISTVSITDILNTMSSQHILVIADSCYSGAMTRAALARLDAGMSPEKKSEWLKAMLKAKSRTVLTSGGLKPVMDGGGGDHSVFANALIKALRTNSGLLEGQELYRNVSANVVAVAADYEVEQVPQYAPVSHAGHEAGEFFFVPK
ncbi:MAG: caspase family protein [Methylomicrobium sp.]